jgi:hypothetical protein
MPDHVRFILALIGPNPNAVSFSLMTIKNKSPNPCPFPVLVFSTIFCILAREGVKDEKKRDEMTSFLAPSRVRLQK